MDKWGVNFEIKGEELIRKKVGKHGTGAVVYVPKQWIGKQVAIILERG